MASSSSPSHLTPNIDINDTNSSSSSSSSSSVSPVPSRPSSPFAKLSISTTSLTSLLPSIYSNNRSVPNLSSNMNGHDKLQKRRRLSPVSASDLLARESDVIVSTNITSQAEYKGFASYVSSGIFMIIWLIWSLCPDTVLLNLGIYYYPSRWWAIAVPSFILISMGYVYIALALYNIEIKTLPLNDLKTIVDDTGVIVTQLEDYNKDDQEDYLFNSTSGIWDLSICDVNKVLYSNKNQ